MLVHVAAKLGQRHATIVYAKMAALRTPKRLRCSWLTCFPHWKPMAGVTALSDLAYESDI